MDCGAAGLRGVYVDRTGKVGRWARVPGGNQVFRVGGAQGSVWEERVTEVFTATEHVLRVTCTLDSRLSSSVRRHHQHRHQQCRVYGYTHTRIHRRSYTRTRIHVRGARGQPSVYSPPQRRRRPVLPPFSEEGPPRLQMARKARKGETRRWSVESRAG